MEEESRLRVRFTARLLDVRQFISSKIHIEDGTGVGFIRHDCVVAYPPVVESHTPNPAVTAELPCCDAGDKIIGKRYGDHALAVEYRSTTGEVKVEVVEAVLPAVFWEVVPVDGSDVEEESRLRVRFAARLLEVRQFIFFKIYIEDGTGGGFIGHDCVVACPPVVDSVEFHTPNPAVIVILPCCDAGNWIVRKRDGHHALAIEYPAAASEEAPVIGEGREIEEEVQVVEAMLSTLW